jgi:hypothetical protein
MMMIFSATLSNATEISNALAGGMVQWVDCIWLLFLPT